MADTDHSLRIAAGADGAGLARRLYRRSPLRRLIKIDWDHRGIDERDVLLASYPRSGSSWLRFLLYEMTAGGASFATVRHGIPYVGRHQRAPSLVPDGGRIIKTHEPYLARYRRAIHLVRDPRQVALSYYSFMQRLGKIVERPGDDRQASLDHFIDALIGGRVDGHGAWQSHLLSWRNAATGSAGDILLVRYEDMRHDSAAGAKRIADWLGLDLTEAAAAEVAQRCTLERMRAAESEALADPRFFSKTARPADFRLVNEGGVEGWRTSLTVDQQRRFEPFAEGLALMGYPPATGAG